MDKYIGFDIDSKKTVACVVQKGKKDKYTRLRTDIEQMKKFLQRQQSPGRVALLLAMTFFGRVSPVLAIPKLRLRLPPINVGATAKGGGRTR